MGNKTRNWIQDLYFFFFLFLSNFIVIQVQFSAFSSHPSLIPRSPHLPPEISTFSIMLTMFHQMNLSAFPYAQHIQTLRDRGKTKQIQFVAQRMQSLCNWAQSDQKTGIFNKAATCVTNNRVPCVLEWRLHGGGRSCGQVGWRQTKREKKDITGPEDGRRNWVAWLSMHDSRQLGFQLLKQT